jgi:signal peptidase I
MSPTVLLADPSVRLAGLRPRRRYVRAVPRRVRWGRLIAGIVLALVLGGLAFLQTWPPLATVMSGSMAPTIDTGDVVLLKRLERPARVGDVVSIAVPDEARSRFGYPPVVIHRVVAIDASGSVKTKGDARKQPDPFTVPRTALTTRVVATVPAAGRGLAFLASPLGLLWLCGGALLLIGMPLLERHREGQRRAAGERDGLEAALSAITAELAALRDARDRAADDTREREHAAAAERERAVAEAHQQALVQRDHVAAEAHQRALADAAERERLVAEAHQRALAEAADRERSAAEAHRRALAETAARERRLVAEAEAAREQARAAGVALARHLRELPTLLERAIADAFVAAPPPPPPPPAPFTTVLAPARMALPAPPRPAAPPAAELAPLAPPARLAAASAPPPPPPFTTAFSPAGPAPSPTPDLLGHLVPASKRAATPDLFGAVKRAAAWDAAPAGLSPRRFAPPVNTFFA